MAALSDLHWQVAGIALSAAAEHGFALGGGNALLAHGLTTRPTLDVDLFTDREDGVEAAAAHAPVDMEVGPVLALEDVAGGKVCALASRIEVRDYADTARMLDRYSPAQLIAFARQLDPGLTAEDFADAGRQLDRIADEEFSRYGLSHHDVSVLRGKFAAWPRTPQAASREAAASGLQHPGTEPEHPSTPTRHDWELGQ
jgi:hypothetical protein